MIRKAQEILDDIRRNGQQLKEAALVHPHKRKAKISAKLFLDQAEGFSFHVLPMKASP
jgi:hypothetical protein